MSFRKCTKCGSETIPSDKPDYVKFCFPCYKYVKDTMRECIVCKQKKIQSTLPEYMNKCRQCYLESKGQSSNSGYNNGGNLGISQYGNMSVPSTSGDLCFQCHKGQIVTSDKLCQRCYSLNKYKENGGTLQF